MITSQLGIGQAVRIHGWMSESELAFLASVAANCKSIIEIGTFRGRSARALADNAPDDCIIDCVDTWNYHIYWSDGSTQEIGITDFNCFYCNLADHIKSGKVRFHIKSWDDYTPLDLVDFIFIDGDHKTESVAKDIDKALFYLKEGGIIAGHDYDWESVKKAVDSIFPTVQVEDRIWTKKV
jgi:predicted O-methyltransferase YrrM